MARGCKHRVEVPRCSNNASQEAVGAVCRLFGRLLEWKVSQTRGKIGGCEVVGGVHLPAKLATALEGEKEWGLGSKHTGAAKICFLPLPFLLSPICPSRNSPFLTLYIHKKQIIDEKQAYCSQWQILWSWMWVGSIVYRGPINEGKGECICVPGSAHIPCTYCRPFIVMWW